MENTSDYYNMINTDTYAGDFSLEFSLHSDGNMFKQNTTQIVDRNMVCEILLIL